MRVRLKKKSLVLACGLFAASFEAQGAPPSPPRVHAVYVDSSSWASAFKSNLAAIGVGSATLGYKIPTAYNSAMRSGVLPHQLKTSPWINIDTIHVAFSENVQITASDFAIKGVNGSNNEVVYSGTFNYNSTTHVATWTTATAFDINKLLIIVSGEVRSVATGVKLAGGWTNPDPSVPRNGSVFPSGGSPGETFFFRANILPGAVTRSAVVSNADLLVVRDKTFTSAGSNGYSPFPDTSGSGIVLGSDLRAVQEALFSQLPSNEPTLTMPSTPTANGSEILVSTPADLNNVSSCLDCSYLVTSSIDMSGVSFTPIDDFEGSFDGGGYEISNISITTSADNAGLFGRLLAGAIVKNVHVRNITINSTGINAGGIAAYLASGASLTDSSSTGSVSIASTASTGGNAGGLVAGVGGVVSRSWSSVNVSATGNNYCHGGGAFGHIGGANARATNVYARGNAYVTCNIGNIASGGLVGTCNFGASLVNCYSSGQSDNLSHSHNEGGMVGFISGCNAPNSYWNTTTSGRTSSRIGSGRSDTAMKTQATFSGWDFDAIWEMEGGEGNGMPVFK